MTSRIRCSFHHFNYLFTFNVHSGQRRGNRFSTTRCQSPFTIFKTGQFFFFFLSKHHKRLQQRSTRIKWREGIRDILDVIFESILMISIIFAAQRCAHSVARKNYYKNHTKFLFHMSLIFAVRFITDNAFHKQTYVTWHSYASHSLTRNEGNKMAEQLDGSQNFSISVFFSFFHVLTLPS